MILRSSFYKYLDLLLISFVFYLKDKCERSELLEDISRYSGILDNNLLLSRTGFLRHSGSKIRDEMTWFAKIIHWIILPPVRTF